MERTEALRFALDVWGKYEEKWGHGPEGIILLARTGLFNHMELATLTDRTPYVILKTTNGIELPAYKFGENFNPNALDAMIILAEQWEDYKYVPTGVLEMAKQGNSLTTISRLTGVPVDKLTYHP